jgi:hypothetical protein
LRKEVMGIKEDFAAFKTKVDGRLASLEGKLANPSTPAEVTTGMQEIVTKLDAMDTATVTPPIGGEEPL